jgi:FAD/FMN-containing dehydrogenase
MVQPYDAQDIAIALSVVRKFGCHFAVLGGGTSPFKGASNAHDGVTIDLYALNTVKFTNSEKKYVKVGGGAIWADVYRYLDPKNMSAVGTRNSLTGVAGSIIGGRTKIFSCSWMLLTVI